MSDEKLLEHIATSIEYRCASICIFPTHTGIIKSHFVGVPNCPNIACAINFPTGSSYTVVRIHEIITCCKQGADVIDLTINMAHVKNGSWNVIEKDIIACQNVCNDHGVLLRAIIEYRMLDDKWLINLVHVLQKNNIDGVINATGTMPDDTYDNVLNSEFLIKHSKLDIVATGRIFTPQHFRMFEGLGLWGVRLRNPTILKNVYTNVGVEE